MKNTRLVLATSVVVGTVLLASCTQASESEKTQEDDSGNIRVAQFNSSLTRGAVGELADDLAGGKDEQAAAIAEILQTNRPEIVVLNEFDYDREALDSFREEYLGKGQNGKEPLGYDYAFTAPVNTGVDSGYDLNNDGQTGTPDDAFGFGDFPGHYGMVVLSTFPIVTDEVRTFQELLWKDMPDARLPDDPATPGTASWYSPEELDVVRLSSKSHWDVPIDVNGTKLSILAAHPTPPTFDGAEDRNGLRNADEIRFWAEYISGSDQEWIVDDEGAAGGLADDREFIIAGDMNSDPVDGDSVDGAIGQILDLDRVQDPEPVSEGAVEAAEKQGGANAAQQGPAQTDTADFLDDPAPGNIRADYVLPSDGLTVNDSGVFWPTSEEPDSALTGEYPFPSSDHRLVWVDITVG